MSKSYNNNSNPIAFRSGVASALAGGITIFLPLNHSDTHWVPSLTEAKVTNIIHPTPKEPYTKGAETLMRLFFTRYLAGESWPLVHHVDQMQ